MWVTGQLTEPDNLYNPVWLLFTIGIWHDTVQKCTPCLAKLGLSSLHKPEAQNQVYVTQIHKETPYFGIANPVFV